MSRLDTGYLLIADITGYTGFLSKTELDHAQGILTELLQVLLHETKPPLALSRLAGDAVVSYALGDAFATGQTFMEMIENTYVAFKRSIDVMVMNTTCTCRACQTIGELDLKFFVHYGTFGRQRLSDHDELVGNDVNLLFRLTKNKVVESTGIKAYALYTQAVMDRLGLDGLTTGSLLPHRESYEHIGEVASWIANMSSVYDARKAASPAPLGPVFLEATIEIATPPSLVWSSLTNPTHMQTLLGAARVGLASLAGGRLSAGSEVHCYHGGDTPQVLRVTEWSPFDRVLVEFAIPIPVIGTVAGSFEYVLESIDQGTRFTQRMTRPTGPFLARSLVTAMLRRADRNTMNDMRAFKGLVENQSAARARIQPVAIPTAQQLHDAVQSSLASPT